MSTWTRMMANRCHPLCQSWSTIWEQLPEHHMEKGSAVVVGRWKWNPKIRMRCPSDHKFALLESESSRPEHTVHEPSLTPTRVCTCEYTHTCTGVLTHSTHTQTHSCALTSRCTNMHTHKCSHIHACAVPRQPGKQIGIHKSSESLSWLTSIWANLLPI